MKKIILTGGGTAGHVSPNLALLPHLLEKGYEVHYIGTKDGIEREMMTLPGVTYHVIHAGKLRRYFDVKNFSDPLNVLLGAGESLGIMRKIKPDALFSKGGFVSVPVVWAASRCAVPILCHESDITPGLANRICARYAQKVCTTFKECADALGSKGVWTGTPLRASLFQGSRDKGLSMAGFAGAKPVLLVMGGSQGARAINMALREALPQLTKGYDIMHLCGKGHMDETLEGTKGYWQAEFLSGALPDVLAAADMVLSRAGANALSEFEALHIPMLLIPLPLSASRGDQIQNAESVVKRGIAAILYQEDLLVDSLKAAIDALEEERPHMLARLREISPTQGTMNVLREMENMQK